MAGTVAIIIKIMPDSPEADLKSIEAKAQAVLEPKGAKNISFEEKPVAFGLKAIFMKMAWPEAQDSSIIEDSLQAIEHVSSVNIEDYRRAFG